MSNPPDLDAAMVEYTEQLTMGGEHGGNNDYNMTLQDVAVVKNTEQPTMGGEQGVNNNDNYMPQAPLQAVIDNIEQPTMSGEQGGNNENKSPAQQTLNEGASPPNLFQDHHILHHPHQPRRQ
jgi:hypothetical protein